MRRLPEVIPIKHEPDYRTSLIGRCPAGQFFADITSAYQKGVRPRPTENWREVQRVYALLHRFDDDGHHLGSDIFFAGVSADNETSARAEEKLSGWLKEIAPITFGDIAIRPFRVDFDNVLFGLIDETDDDLENGHGKPWAELYPQNLGFCEPWNGEYDT